MALSGSVTTDNPTALAVRHLSNMLVQGSGFTRATPQISPSPTIFGYSDINASLPTVASPNGRPLFHFQRDNLTDDIYLYDSTTASNRRVSVTKFGFPTNYLGQANMSSHRYPSLSGDGRFIFFSSDAGGLGGLIFDNSNQVPVPVNDNNRRDIFVRDLKDSTLPVLDYSITIEEDFFVESGYRVVLNNVFPIHVKASIPLGSISEIRLYNNSIQVNMLDRFAPGSNTIQDYFAWQPDQIGPSKVQLSIVDNLGNEYFSRIYPVSVIQNPTDVYSGELIIEPKPEGQQIFILNPIFEPINILIGGVLAQVGREFRNSYDVEGPFTEDEVQEFISAGGIRNLGLAEAYFTSENPELSRPFSEVYPFRPLITQGSTLSALSNYTGKEGKRPVLRKVSYFLNGKKLNDQIEPPFYSYFTPPSISEDKIVPLTGWSFSALAYDTNDNIHVSSQFGHIFFSEIFPSLDLNLASGYSSTDGQIYDGQIVRLAARASGNFSSLNELFRVHFFINGHLFSTDSGTPFRSSDGNIEYIDYNTTLDIDYKKYAKPDGSISIVAFGEMNDVSGYIPSFRSNTLNMSIKKPIPWIDPGSSIISLFNDLTDQKPNADQVQLLLSNLQHADNNVNLAAVNQSIQTGAFSDRIDIVAAHKCVFGEWHAEYELFKADCNRYIGVSSNYLGPQVIDPYWLKQYISDLLISSDYSFKYTRLPYLIGSYETSDIINYQSNRRIFVNRHFYNKYDIFPTLQQLHQGSYNMLQWWATFDNDYWELPGGSNDTNDLGLSIRIDDFRYNAGEVAVDFIFNLAKETEFIKGVPYMMSTERLQESKFTVVALMHQLWKSNADIISNTEVNLLSELPTRDAIQSILSDYRYTSRHNTMWIESEKLGEDYPDWKKEDWFGGSFFDTYFPWVYHEDLDWIYFADVSTSSFWFYSDKLGWVWTGAAHYPYLYSNRESSWIYFYDIDNVLNPSANEPIIKRYLYIQKTRKHIPYNLY
jgi:hypothetical protein